MKLTLDAVDVVATIDILSKYKEYAWSINSIGKNNIGYGCDILIDGLAMPVHVNIFTNSTIPFLAYIIDIFDTHYFSGVSFYCGEMSLSYYTQQSKDLFYLAQNIFIFLGNQFGNGRKEIMLVQNG